MKIISKKKISSPVVYNGFVDNHWGPNIRGWAMKSDSEQPVTVRIQIEDKVHYIEASSYRQDLKDKGLHPSGYCGFLLPIGRKLKKPAQVTIVEDALTLQPSLPFFKNKKFFYLHIPKTAGSSFNIFLESQIATGNFYFHIEGVKEWGTLNEMQAISGHITLPRFKDNFIPNEYVTFTFFRNPIDQLVSHLYWVRHLSEPGVETFKQNHPPVIQKMSEKLMQMNFSDIYEINHFIKNLNLAERSLFDNCQCRYLHPIPPNRKYANTDLEMAMESLSEIDLIGVTEHFDQTIELVTNQMGWEKRQTKETPRNVNRFSYGIDKTDMNLIEAISPLIEHDLKLYELACERFEMQLGKI